jgi:hypothetical protein
MGRRTDEPGSFVSCGEGGLCLVEEALVWLARCRASLLGATLAPVNWCLVGERRMMMSRKRKKPHNMRPKGGRTTPKKRN